MAWGGPSTPTQWGRVSIMAEGSGNLCATAALSTLDSTIPMPSTLWEHICTACTMLQKNYYSQYFMSTIACGHRYTLVNAQSSLYTTYITPSSFGIMGKLWKWSCYPTQALIEPNPTAENVTSMTSSQNMRELNEHHLSSGLVLCMQDWPFLILTSSCSSCDPERLSLSPSVCQVTRENKPRLHVQTNVITYVTNEGCLERWVNREHWEG